MEIFLKNILIWCLDMLRRLTFKDYLLILLFLSTLMFYGCYRHYKSLTPIIVYNTDSLEIYKNKLNEEYVSKHIYVQDIDNLKKQNTDLSEEVKNLKNNPIIVTKTDLLLRIDTIQAVSDEIVKKDTIYELNWHLSEPKNYYSINGLTKVHDDFSNFVTLINEMTLKANLTIDVIEEKENLRIISKVDNPYIKINNLDGVVFDPTKSKVLKKYYNLKKWSIGPQIGYGLTSDLKFKPYIGVGLSYGIILF